MSVEPSSLACEAQRISEAKHAIRPMYNDVGHPRQEARCELGEREMCVERATGIEPV